MNILLFELHNECILCVRLRYLSLSLSLSHTHTRAHAHTHTHTSKIIEWKMIDNYITKIKGFWIIHWALNAKTLRYDENWEVITSNIPCEQ